MDEQRQFEQHWIDQLKPSLNMNRSFNTHADTLEYHRKKYEKNKEKYKQQMKEHYKQNKENRKQQMKEHYKQNKEKYKQQSKEHYKQNKEKYKQQSKEHRKKNIEKITKYQKEYRDNIRRSCVCGGRYRDVRSFRDRHFNSTKHTSFVLDFYERLNNMLSENNYTDIEK
jgi:hypothetical protein